MKAQGIRLFDVFVLGPLMVVAGVTLARSDAKALGTFIGVAGLATIGYNARNYGRIEEASGVDRIAGMYSRTPGQRWVTLGRRRALIYAVR